jgi:mitotic spindle assembly checkpoint protein MAD2
VRGRAGARAAAAHCARPPSPPRPPVAPEWLTKGEIQKLVVVVTGVESGDTLERWAFNVETDRAVARGGTGAAREKPLKEIQSEIQAILRQVTASVTFLPLLDEPCAFDLLVYADRDATVPVSWEDSDPRYIARSTEVKLRSFTTKVHRVDASVVYRDADADV